MNLAEAVLVAILQGATELFPVSSLGHAVVVPSLLRTAIDQQAEAFLPFVVMLHFGTAVALLQFFWRDWWRIATGVLGIGPAAQVREQRRLFLLVVVATVPAVLVGAALESRIRALFAAPAVAAGFLVLNGVMLMFGERLRRRGGRRGLAELSWTDALFIGCWQCLALVPGISRSGATMVAGLLRGVDHLGAAHFSFLIATPIILGAAVHETPKLLHASVPPGTFATAGIAAVVAGLVAWASTWLLMRYFRSHDDWALNPFAWYCMALGLGALAWFAVA